MSLTLWQIDETLAQMTDLLEEMVEACEDVTELSAQIEAYITDVLPNKVDAIAAVLRMWKSVRVDAVDERQRVAKIVQQFDAKIEGLQNTCVAVMQKRGYKKLTGKTNVMRVQVNGGPASVEPYDYRLIPDEFHIAIVRMPKDLWIRLIDAGCPAGSTSYTLGEYSVTYDIDTDGIRDRLQTPCQNCCGTGSQGDEVACDDCGGTGFCLVPGARLKPRGAHLRVS